MLHHELHAGSEHDRHRAYQGKIRTIRRKVFNGAANLREGEEGWRVLHVMHTLTQTLRDKNPRAAGNHWVLLEVRMTKGHVQPYVYDGNMERDTHTAEAMRITRLLADTEIAGLDPTVSLPVFPRTPRQGDGYQCGMLAWVAMHTQATKGAQSGQGLTHNASTALWDVRCRNLLAALVLVSEQHAPEVTTAFEQASVSLTQRAAQAREYLADTAETGQTWRPPRAYDELRGMEGLGAADTVPALDVDSTEEESNEEEYMAKQATTTRAHTGEVPHGASGTMRRRMWQSAPQPRGSTRHSMQK